MNNTISPHIFLTRDGNIVGIKDTIKNCVSVASRRKNRSFWLTRDGRINCELKSNCDFVAVAAGWDHSLALTRDGYIVGWGSNGHCQINRPSGNNFVAIAAGAYHSLALTRDGRVVGWGFNRDGQTSCPEGDNFVAIAAGFNDSLALTNDGRVVGWGANGFGQINCPSGDNFVAISAGVWHSLALTRDGRVVGWGYNENGQIECPPQKGGNNFVAISAGNNHSVALTIEGKIVLLATHPALYVGDVKEKIALPYDFLTRLNKNVKVLCSIPKYIQMEILEDYTDWTFGNLYYL